MARSAAAARLSRRAQCAAFASATASAPLQAASPPPPSVGAPIVVVAFGGNALLKRGEPLTMEVQQRNAKTAAAAVRQLVDAGYSVCCTHGNGPQVGMLALQDPTARLEVLDAETEGQLGFLLELELANALQHRQVAALLTQVVVDPGDEAFQHPRKQVGPRYSKQEAEQMARDKGWAAGIITVCCGGGGIPVAVDGRGMRRGVEAVVDKDEASALLGIKLKADWLLMLTDAGAIYDPSGWPREQRPIPSPVKAGQLQMSFASGSMAPKVAAACRFVTATGGKAAVGSIGDALHILQGRAGTVIEA
ncbi:hypothetical protein CHLNCDRAFT_140326 [Chlorella variabilis]|uniref:Carbamate kinase n=1 Tax=Chlorella variabilis TaxID=554065 RepID=E1Z6S2_CHLVA|nr:hypothetical protein CHLNCDRAFT_140326 [Chlorella variabilis]EFN58399.1 hypothetical protein CHLNCDRAFT_140326 [Chlorella variabilis]|eukprot:XP_005850501.1 hypothetical protein CHLNCDRAFT_140326 [Chlorella variabilis]